MVSKVRQYKRTIAREEKLVWVKRAKTIDYKSDNLKIAFTYTDIMPEHKKVTVQENGNQIRIYTEGYEERTDRILLLKKDSTELFSEYLIKKDKMQNTRFFNIDHHDFNNQLEVVEMYKFGSKALRRHTGLTFEDLHVSKYNEIEHVFLFQIPNIHLVTT